MTEQGTIPTAQAAYEAAIRADERERLLAAIVGGIQRINGKADAEMAMSSQQQPAPATGKALTTDADLRKELKLAKVKALRGKYKATPFVDVTPDDFLAYVRKHPGLRAEEVAKGLGAKKLPMVAIRNALGKKLKTKGARRGMRYWVR